MNDAHAEEDTHTGWFSPTRLSPLLLSQPSRRSILPVLPEPYTGRLWHFNVSSWQQVWLVVTVHRISLYPSAAAVTQEDTPVICSLSHPQLVHLASFQLDKDATTVRSRATLLFPSHESSVSDQGIFQLVVVRHAAW